MYWSKDNRRRPHVDLVHDGEEDSRHVNVALVGCTGLLGEIISRTVREQPDFVVVESLEPEALAGTNYVEADIVLWNDADEATVAGWLGKAHSAPRVLATLGDGRNASLWQLTPQRTDLGALSPSVLVKAIRAEESPSSPARGTDPEE